MNVAVENLAKIEKNKIFVKGVTHTYLTFLIFPFAIGLWHIIIPNTVYFKRISRFITR